MSYWPLESPLPNEFPIPNLCPFFYLVILLLSIHKESFNISSFNHLTAIYNVNCFPESFICLLLIYVGHVLLRFELTAFWIFVSCFISLRKKEDNKVMEENKSTKVQLLSLEKKSDSSFGTFFFFLNN